MGRRHLALLFHKHTKAPETGGVGPRTSGHGLVGGSREPERRPTGQGCDAEGQGSLFSYRKACFVEMTFHMFMLKCLKEESTRGEIAYLQFGKR